jgi:Mn2+/Fe2+ NRAMP family transporter
MGSIAQIMAIPETILFYLLLPCTVIGIAFGWKRRFNQSLLLLSIITAIMLLLALLEGNSGTLFRHRSVVFYLIFIFTAIGISLKGNKRRRC